MSKKQPPPAAIGRTRADGPPQSPRNDYPLCGAAKRDGRMGIGITLAEAAREWRNRMDERLVSYGMSQSRWVVLSAAGLIGKPLSQHELAGLAGVEPPTLVRILDRLEADGWVRRTAAEEDRRVKLVTLTPKAHEFLEDLRRVAVQLRNEVLEGIAEEDIRLCHDVLLRIRDHLFRLAARDPIPPAPR